MSIITPRRTRAGRVGKRLAIGLLATAAVATVPASASAYVKVTNVASGLKADVMWGDTATYAGVFLWTSNLSLSQRYYKLDGGNGYFRLKAQHSDKCLAVDPRATSANGTPIVQQTNCDVDYALAEWHTTQPFGSSDVLIINRQSGRCLDANNGAGGAPPQQSVLQQWDCIFTAFDWNAGNQIWRIS